MENKDLVSDTRRNENKKNSLFAFFQEHILLTLLSVSILLLESPSCVSSKNVPHTIHSHGHNSNSKISCRNQMGQALDWFIAYKLAKIESSQDVKVRAGLGYSFLYPTIKSKSKTKTQSEFSSRSDLEDWKFASESINDTNSIVGMTLASLFFKNGSQVESQEPNDLLFLTWNDQPPNGPAIAINAHSKGVVIANEEGGVWVQHSVPHFPNLQSSPHYSYPLTGTHNGQLFLCSTLTPTQLDGTIVEILQIIKPHVFESHFPKQFEEIYPNMGKFIGRVRKVHSALSSKGKEKKSNADTLHKDGRNTRTRSNNRIIRRSKKRNNGHAFNKDVDDFPSKIFNLELPGLKNVTIFAKSPKFNEEIYSDWIAPHLKSSLRVQSWLNGAHPLPSNCTIKTLSVFNILEKTIDGNTFSTHSDHSKWAVTEKSSKNFHSSSVNDLQWVCTSDLNRMDHQKKRGGAAVCIPDADLWTRFQNVITSLQPCGGE